MITPDLIKGKNILLRADLDVPVKEGKVVNDFRLQALLPTIKLCLGHAKSTLIIGHLGRPRLAEAREGGPFNLNPVREWLETALHQSIFFISSGYSPGEWAREVNPIAMLDNLRFAKGELSNDREFAKQLSKGSQVYIYEAFAAYNSAASLQIIPEILPTYTGIQFDREVETITNILKNAARPSLLVLSGVKEDKKHHVDNLLLAFDKVLVGGRLAASFHDNINPRIIPATLTEDTFDIDSVSIDRFTSELSAARTIVLNGPLGRFEDDLHTQGTKSIFEVIKNSPAFSLLGGGDTLDAIPSLGFFYSDFDFVSTGGGAMLEFLATGTHPLLTILKKL